MKRVAVIGGNGKVAKLVLQKLKSTTKYEPLSIIRNESQVGYFQKLNINTAVISLEEPANNLSHAIANCDAVIFCAGAGGKGLDLTFAIDLDGAVKMMEACQIAGIKRFIMLSAIKADDREFWYGTALRSYYIAKKYADNELVNNTKLDWTILRPGSLLGEDNLGQGTGKITNQIDNLTKKEDLSSEDMKKLVVTRDDVAQTIVECLELDNTIGKTIDFINGDIPIKDLLKTL